MCRIDAPFGDHSLNESTDPVERFIQALDEHSVDGNFRSLLTEHFSKNWKQVFREIEPLEEALKCAQQHSSDYNKFSEFLSSPSVAFRLSLEFTHKKAEYLTGKSNRDCPLLDFAIEVARKTFPKSAYSFYKLVSEKAINEKFNDVFLSIFYENDYCLSSAFFNDEALTSLDFSDRSRFFLNYFNSIAGDYDSQPHYLFSILNEGILYSSKKPNSNELLRGITFLKSWLKHDAQAGRLGYECRTLVDIATLDWYYGFQRAIQSIGKNQCLDKNTLSSAEEWLQKTWKELKTEYFTNANLISATNLEIECWAKGLDDFFISLCNTCFDNDSPVEEWQLHYDNCLIQLCSKLSSSQVEAWIKWTINEDIQSTLRTERASNLSYSKKWCEKKHSPTWKKKFLEAFHNVDIESQLRLLDAKYPFHGEGVYQEGKNWWNELLRNLINNVNFPNELTPKWAMVTRHKLLDEERKPFIDKSIGILRGNISKGIKPEHDQELKQLLSEFDRLDAPKSLRHRLMLMRSSNKPFADESISRFSSLNEDQAVNWYSPLDILATDWFSYQKQPQRGESATDWSKAKSECYEFFSHRLAEFCLSRLRLRKGEKTNNGKYDPDQVIEASPIWRQGYLKALGELGFDLNGKAHKTVYFTQQHDPDESVRKIAKECYRLVRRNSNKTRSIEDLKRAIIAAEWWLLICQRRELNEDVNYEEALKVRRRLLRNPQL
ncbi:hypothetical protein [uncultured Amphritea sp.]|uniref:hypothetical protein n=1 Tax=uncultured Amphritea sp. TaxID=981605 RepID=UPI00262B727E|nr:hypothetical protein [uncultured Amphritea sp.]